jgi:2-keto-4-pentenoate hydratase/2-oxohepta-3-ene-1,7-dioic acid hydratase in catechol pathway
MSSITNRSTGEQLPVGKILCLGRNYAEHAREMKADVPETPVVFLKPSTAILHQGGMIIIPPRSRQLHYEVEMVVVIGTRGARIPREQAMEHVAGYAVGLDMTLRDLQAEAKKKGLPWALAKGFDTSAPVSSFTPRERIEDPHALELSLAVNGVDRQRASTREMIFRVDEIISFLSEFYTLEQGDLIYTGTPEGVGEVKPGDLLEARLQSVGTLTVTVG